MTARTGDRRVGRERAVQALFSLESASLDSVEGGLTAFWNTLDEETTSVARAFAAELVRGVVTHRVALDELLQHQSTAWRVERMAKVDRNVLRVAVFELLHTDTPPPVVINEAVEIAKSYGSEESSAFVNGLLDKLARTRGLL